jgi:hypothetical protein
MFVFSGKTTEAAGVDIPMKTARLGTCFGGPS